MKKNILIIGFGYMGTLHAKKIEDIIQKTQEQYTITVIDQNIDRVNVAISKKYDAHQCTTLEELTELLQQLIPDVVVISTNTVHHFECLKKIIETYESKSLHLPALFIEKPIVATCEEADKIRDMLNNYYENSDNILMGGYLIRESAAVKKLINIMREEQLMIQDIKSIEIQWLKLRSPERPSPGVNIDEYTHPQDLLRYIFRELGIKYTIDKIEIVSAQRSQEIVNKEQQLALYADDQNSLFPFAKIQYKLQFQNILIEGTSSFLDAPQTRTIKFIYQNGKEHIIEFDRKIATEQNKICDILDGQIYVSDKIENLWETFFNYLKNPKIRPIHIATLEELLADVFDNNDLTNAAIAFNPVDEYLQSLLTNEGNEVREMLLFSKKHVQKAEEPKANNTYCGLKPGFLL